MFPFSSTDHHKLASVKKKMEKAGYKMSSSSSSDEATIVIDNDQFLLISQFYPDLYTNPPLHDQVPKQDESKTCKKRRKRSKGSKEAMETTTTTSNGEMTALMKKRKLSDEQVKMLELNFGNEHKLESERKDRIASELSLDPRQVAVWFQNRRARWKNKRLEEEYSKLKSAYDGITVEKCGLEAEVMKVKEQLSKANKEIERLSQPPPLPPSFQLDEKASRSSTTTTTTVGSPSSSSSSFSMVIDSHFPEDFVVDGFDHSLLYSPAEYNYNWVNLFGF